MSFILDALKKSETDRQRQGSAEFAGVPTSSGRHEGPPLWMWIVGVLLIVNLAVLTGVLLRPDAENSAGVPVGAASAANSFGPEGPPTAAPAARPADDFASQVAAARENAPAIDETIDETVAEPATQPGAGSVTIEPASSAMLPTVHEVQARGVVSLPPLHVDIHVFSESAEDRFVFINMVKHKEGSRLAAGPLVREITPDGVVLEQNGTSFLLPRD